jgi:archaellum component FlaF (FlaF/FlaG flagellin family)
LPSSVTTSSVTLKKNSQTILGNVVCNGRNVSFSPSGHYIACTRGNN